MAATPLELARAAAMAADSKKAEDLVVIDLSLDSDVCDYFVICTAANARMADAIVDEVEEKLRVNYGERPLSSEGRADGAWILMDYGALVVHVFQPESREFYRLDNLWGDAPRVEL